MTQAASLLAALQATDMLEIDGLYAWHFELHADRPEQLLSIEVMDGSTRRLWRFTEAEVAAAQFDAAGEVWTLSAGASQHRLKCLEALVADSDAPDDEDEEVE
ncbi:DUF5629 family protein [Pseudomonas sp. UL073]|uniref:DUF5629 family protein n=1 Tax=Zestomonas insulae TaxID=2809017 RepID=A0ABS2IE59_9GAMM|nr:DUF5629 family protein [Pseudomonas insulae]MBM7061381.1 DUF5629 family protein [Pseudomonas insulae]